MDDIKKSLKNGRIFVCAIGTGRIGLPTALSFAHSGLPTIGVDVNSKLVQMINSGDFPLKDEPGFDKMFDEVIKNKNFHATTNIEEAVPHSDVILLSLPTPMSKDHIPDYSALISVGKNLNKLLKPGSLVVVESTVQPGFIENEFVSVIETGTRKLKVGKDFGMAVCPEIANPGEIWKDFKNLPRLVGALDKRTADIVAEIYRYVFGVEIVLMPDCKSANAAKLTSNVFRDINIAFVNELAILFEKLGIDILKVLEACDKKYNFQIHYPGAGVGGPCLPVNSYQILNSVRNLDNNMLKIIKAARKINEKMPCHVVDLLLDALNEAGKKVKGSTVVILGLSYKPNVRDIQLTPAEEIIKKLENLQAKIKIYDPYFKSVKVFSHNTESNLMDAITNADAILLITAHNEFHDLSPTLLASKMTTPIIVDSGGLLDAVAAKKAGLIFRGIGRGGI
ncbi:MAG: nucleotide sugar dehydrogenase [Thaumarchaeota archaeon]|nr:nucleotide sugar dehydrogenase [Nitrososphaerota archaeon]